MNKTIKKLKKKLKKETTLNQKLRDEIIEYHNDIIFLDEYNFSLEQENTLLEKKVTDYEEVYLRDTKSEFDKHLQAIMIKVGTIKNNDKSFYKDALKYLSGYIQALEKYSTGDTKKILGKIQNYKIQTKEAKAALHELRYGKKSLFENIDKISHDIKIFRKKVSSSI